MVLEAITLENLIDVPSEEQKLRIERLISINA